MNKIIKVIPKLKLLYYVESYGQANRLPVISTYFTDTQKVLSKSWKENE